MLPIPFEAFVISLIEWINHLDAKCDYEIREETCDPPFGDGKTLEKNIYKGDQPIFVRALEGVALELIPIYQKAVEEYEDDNPDVEGYLESQRETNE
jgi:hypothetical protein